MPSFKGWDIFDCTDMSVCPSATVAFSTYVVYPELNFLVNWVYIGKKNNPKMWPKKWVHISKHPAMGFSNSV